MSPKKRINQIDLSKPQLTSKIIHMNASTPNSKVIPPSNQNRKTLSRYLMQYDSQQSSSHILYSHERLSDN